MNRERVVVIVLLFVLAVSWACVAVSWMVVAYLWATR
jgi:hypothetical protein